MLLQIVVLLTLVGMVIWGILRWIAGTPALLTDVKACRGNWAEARLRHCEGELAVTGIPVEPFNTFSNLAYIAAAWVVWQTFPGLPAVVLAASLVLLGIGSSMYHGTKAMWAAKMDHAGMYAVFGSLAIYCVAPTDPAMPYVMLAGAASVRHRLCLRGPGGPQRPHGAAPSLAVYPRLPDREDPPLWPEPGLLRARLCSVAARQTHHRPVALWPCHLASLYCHSDCTHVRCHTSVRPLTCMKFVIAPTLSSRL